MKKVIPLITALAFASMSGASAQILVKGVNQTDLTLGQYWWSTNPALAIDNLTGASGSASSIEALQAQWLGSSVTLLPTTATNAGGGGVSNTNWYSPFVAPGPGSTGNRQIVSFLYGQQSNLSPSFTSINFSGTVADFNLGTNNAGVPFTLTAIIRDFPLAGGTGGPIVTTVLPLTGEGFFSLDHNLVVGVNRRVQWGLALTGPNIWPTDTDQRDEAGFVTVIPEPSTYALLGLAAVGGLLARRFRRKV